MPFPTHVNLCTFLQETAINRAARWFDEYGEPNASGRARYVIAEGLLACLAERTERGLYQARWSLDGREISRLDAEDAVQRHLAQLAETA